MKVKNMTGASGNKIANQFIIEGASMVVKSDKFAACGTGKQRRYDGDIFQSYDSVIAFKPYVWDHINRGAFKVYLDAGTWDYSVTTGKYRNQFLNENIAATRAKIKSGEYKLVNLN